jgi:hypothetical protein
MIVGEDKKKIYKSEKNGEKLPKKQLFATFWVKQYKATFYVL